MARNRRLTASEMVDKLTASERADVLRESVAWIVAGADGSRRRAQIGAGSASAPRRAPVSETATASAAGRPAPAGCPEPVGLRNRFTMRAGSAGR